MQDLPYTDTKPQGAPDFYYAINATFRFIISRIGRDGWIRYLEELGHGYYEPVNRMWRAGGLPAVAGYWRAFFKAEPGAEVAVHEGAGRVDIHVTRCPAIAHLRAGHREIVREYCQHCYHLGKARAEALGLTMRLSGGNGECRHLYAVPSETTLPEQDINAIREVT